jgi:hypothetical protein
MMVFMDLTGGAVVSRRRVWNSGANYLRRNLGDVLIPSLGTHY